MTLTTPDPWIQRFADRVARGGSVLDLACGAGRHGRLFLERGHPVTLVDRDLGATHDLAESAERIEADLESGPWPLAGRRFDVVIVCNYLWRPLLPRIAATVSPGGLLLYVTFAMGQERIGRPRNPEFLLRPRELLQAFGNGFRVLGYEALGAEDGAPSCRQSLAARRVAA